MSPPKDATVIVAAAPIDMGPWTAWVGQYLAFYDPDARDGLGDFGWTDDKDAAIAFLSVAQAMELWRQPSRVRPFRDDGKPNRPLTAYTITFERLSA